MENCLMVLSQLSTQLNQTGDKQPAQTRQTARSHDCCPGCNKRSNKIIFYSCCLASGCSSCYSGFHYLECPKKSRATIQHIAITQKIQSVKCQRCQQQTANKYESCKQCKISQICEQCSNHIHSASKFRNHCRIKHNIADSIPQNNMLICNSHNKIRNIISQSNELMCSDCHSSTKCRKYKTINYQSPNCVQNAKQQIEGLNKDICHRQFQHKIKWKQLKHQLKQQYDKLLAILNEKYEQNSIALRQMEEFDMRVVEKALIESKKAIRQCYLDSREANVDKNVLAARLNLLSCELMKQRQNILGAQLFVYKVSNSELQKFQNVIKNFTVSKLKLRQPDDKQNNPSVKKWNNSSNQKPTGGNLSMSRRSLSKSISKIQNTRHNDLRQSMTNSISRSQNLSQQINTQPIRNATPPHTNKQMNSSDKKSAIMRQSSIMSAKLEDITPVMLNFDSKQSCGSRINFLSNKTQEESNHLTENNTSQTRPSKRKSDYFDLRDRMRKPNLISNRFSKQR